MGVDVSPREARHGRGVFGVSSSSSCLPPSPSYTRIMPRRRNWDVRGSVRRSHGERESERELGELPPRNVYIRDARPQRARWLMQAGGRGWPRAVGNPLQRYPKSLAEKSSQFEIYRPTGSGTFETARRCAATRASALFSNKIVKTKAEREESNLIDFDWAASNCGCMESLFSG